ncbi:MAG: nuclear transport factor 2 family protein [Spirulina sp.]
MTSEQCRSIIHQAAEAWITGDADTFASLFLPDGEFIVPNNCWVGTAKIKQVAADFAADYEVKIEIQRIIVDGDRAVVEWHWSDIEKATGKCNQADDAIVVDFKMGKISRWREYIDATSFKC